jgi:hypothetical protein
LVSTFSLGVKFLADVFVFRIGDYWRVSTGLPGIDYLVNEFVSLQYDFTGRCLLIVFSALVCVAMFFLAIFMPDSEHSVWDKADPVFAQLAMGFAGFILLPVVFGGFCGGVFVILKAV